MNSHVHPLFAALLAPMEPKVQPCDNCGPAPCNFYPCENVTHPMIPDDDFGDPQDMRLEALPREA